MKEIDLHGQISMIYIRDREAVVMCDNKDRSEENKTEEKKPLSENWPEEGIQDILDYIEEQGVYIRE